MNWWYARDLGGGPTGGLEKTIEIVMMSKKINYLKWFKLEVTCVLGKKIRRVQQSIWTNDGGGGENEDQRVSCWFSGFLNKTKKLDPQCGFTFAKYFMAVMIHLLEITGIGLNSPSIFQNKGSKYFLSYPKYILKVSVYKVSYTFLLKLFHFIKNI